MTYNICEINVLLRKRVQYIIPACKSQDIPAENRSTNTNLLLFEASWYLYLYSLKTVPSASVMV